MDFAWFRLLAQLLPGVHYLEVIMNCTSNPSQRTPSKDQGCDRPLLGTSFCKFLPPSCLMNADFRDLPLLHCACSSQHRPSPIEFLWRRVEGVVCARPLSSSWAQVLRSTFSARQRTPGDLVGVWPLLSDAT